MSPWTATCSSQMRGSGVLGQLPTTGDLAFTLSRWGEGREDCHQRYTRRCHANVESRSWGRKTGEKPTPGGCWRARPRCFLPRRPAGLGYSAARCPGVAPVAEANPWPAWSQSSVARCDVDAKAVGPSLCWPISENRMIHFSRAGMCLRVCPFWVYRGCHGDSAQTPQPLPAPKHKVSHVHASQVSSGT